MIQVLEVFMDCMVLGYNEKNIGGLSALEYKIKTRIKCCILKNSTV